MDLIQRIKQLTEDTHPGVLAIRRHLHAHPELSMQEEKTAAYLAARLTEMGIAFRSGVAKTGLVAEIPGKDPGRAMIALRADMDALPIEEHNNVPYRSVNQGVMHACGHDVHMACLLGAAGILSQLRGSFHGTVRLIFQPSEENYPGGASMMINEGVLENPRPSAMFGQHVFPGLPAGKVGVKSGKYMASTDEIYLTVKGKGGHAATPHLVTDPVLMASHIVVAMQQIVSRHSKPYMPTVLSFGRIIGNGQTNIIPDTVTLDGTVRTFDEVWRAEIHELISRIAVNVARSMGGDCEVRIAKGYPFLVNDPILTEKFTEYASEYLGREHVVPLDLAMTAEDFAYFSQIVPSCFYRLGIANKGKGIVSNLHTSTFDIDEEALKTGAGLMAYSAIRSLPG